MKKLTGKKPLLVVLFISILAFSSVTISAEAARNERFRLIHSDKLFLSASEQENILELFGNVHFFYGKTEFFSNRAIIFETQKIAKLIGNVKVLNDTLMLNADSVSYFRNTDRIDVAGNVVITEQKQEEGVFNRIRSDKGVYDMANGIITATSRVTAESRKEKFRARCNYAFWDRKNGYGYLLEHPELWSEGKDTLHVRSEKMEFFDADRKIIATFNVVAQSKDYKVTSDFLLYFLKEDKAIFQGEPRFTSEFADAEAIEFYLFFKDRELYRAELKDSCEVWFAEERGFQKTNWIRASFISMNIYNDTLKDFLAEDKVTFFFEQKKRDKKDFFSSNAEGEVLEAAFKEDGKLDTMKIKRSVTGIYRFENNP